MAEPRITDAEFADAGGRIEVHPAYQGRPPRETRVDTLGYARWLTDYYTLRAKGPQHEPAIREVERRIAAVAGLPDPWPPPPAPPSLLRAVEGRLVIDSNGRSLRDARGPITPTSFHDGSGLWLEKHDPARVHRWRREARAAGYQIEREFCTLAWGGGRAVNPVDITDFDGDHRAAWSDYMDVFHSMLDDLREVGLKIDISFGDMQQVFRGQDERRAFVRSLGRNIRQWGHQDTVAWFQVNEYWQNLSPDVSQVRDVLRAMAEELPGTLWGNGAGPYNENEGAIASTRQGVPLAIYHPERVDPGPDFTNQIRRMFTVGKDEGVVKPIAATEPIGQGTSVRGTRDGGGLAMHAVAAHMGQIPYTWICGAGIWGQAGSDAGVDYPAELNESAGFLDVPRLVAMLPPELPTFEHRQRGGHGSEPIYQDGGYYTETGWGAGRVDSAWSSTHVVTIVHHVEGRRVDRLKSRVSLGRVRVYSDQAELLAEDTGRIPPFSQRAVIVAER